LRRGQGHRPGDSSPKSSGNLFEPLLLDQGPAGREWALALSEKLISQHGGAIDYVTGPARHQLFGSPCPCGGGRKQA